MKSPNSITIFINFATFDNQVHLIVAKRKEKIPAFNVCSFSMAISLHLDQLLGPMPTERLDSTKAIVRVDVSCSFKPRVSVVVFVRWEGFRRQRFSVVRWLFSFPSISRTHTHTPRPRRAHFLYENRFIVQWFYNFVLDIRFETFVNVKF